MFLERLEHDEGEHNAEGKAHGSHDGVEGEGKECQREGLPRPALENARDGEDNEGGGDVARMEMLVGNVDGGTGDGEGEHGGESGHAGPLGKDVGGFGEEARGDAAGCPEDDKEGEQLPEERGPGDGDVGDADELGNGTIEDGKAQLEAEEVGIVREECGVEVGLDAGEVDAVILHAGVIAHDEEAECREKEGEGKRAEKARLSQMKKSPSVRAWVRILEQTHGGFR